MYIILSRFRLGWPTVWPNYCKWVVCNGYCQFVERTSFLKKRQHQKKTDYVDLNCMLLIWYCMNSVTFARDFICMICKLQWTHYSLHCTHTDWLNLVIAKWTPVCEYRTFFKSLTSFAPTLNTLWTLCVHGYEVSRDYVYRPLMSTFVHVSITVQLYVDLRPG